MGIDKKLIYVLTFSILLSLLITFGKFVLNLGINPLIYMLYYQCVAFGFLFIYTFIIRKQKLNFLNRKNIKNLLIFSFIISLGLIASIFGLEMSTSINYGFILKSTVIFGPLLAFFFLNEKLSKIKIVLIPIFLLGVYLVSTNGGVIIPQRGDILILTAAFLFSVTDVLVKRLTKNIDVNSLVVSRGFLITFFMFIFSIIFVKDLTPNIPFIHLLTAGFIAAGSQLFLLKTIAECSVSYLSMMTMAVPVIVSILGLIFLKENMSLFQIIGGIIIIISGILTQKKNI